MALLSVKDVYVSYATLKPSMVYRLILKREALQHSLAQMALERLQSSMPSAEW